MRTPFVLAAFLLGLASSSSAQGLVPDPPKVCDSCDEWNKPKAPKKVFGTTYLYDARDSINASFYRDHAITGRVDHQFGRILGTVRGDVRLRGYRGIDPMVGPATRDDVIFAVGARAQYVLKDWMAIVADYKTEIDQTEYLSAEPNDPSYTRTEVTVGVRAAL